jgi:hypothetical protein
MNTAMTLLHPFAEDEKRVEAGECREPQKEHPCRQHEKRSLHHSELDQQREGEPVLLPAQIRTPPWDE